MSNNNECPSRDGLGDGRAICEALGFDPANHHNAEKCPYCNPNGWALQPVPAFDAAMPSGGWRTMSSAPKGRDQNGILQQVLLIGAYPSNGHHTDIVQSWWCPVGTADIDGYWERWRHAFPPSYWMPVPAPPSASYDGDPKGEDPSGAESRSDASAVGRKSETPQVSVSSPPNPPPTLTVEEAPPCHWGGGNDIIWCSTCGAEYAYAKGETRPDCPRLLADQDNSEGRDA